MAEAEQKPGNKIPKTWYKGILVGRYHEIDQIETMDIRDDDVWVCSYPRSGTTLTQEMVYLIVTGDFEKVYNVHLDERFPIIEVKGDTLPYYKGLKYVEDMTSPRMIKSHLPNFLLPEQLREGKGKIIYICRNPKDILTSYFRLMEWFGELEDNTSLDQFTDTFIKGEVLYGLWTKHVLGFWKRLGANVLFLMYEDVLKDLTKTIRTIAEFLKKELKDEQVEKIHEYVKFDNMKGNDKCNLSYYRSYTTVNDNSGSRSMNKVKLSYYRSYTTVNDNSGSRSMNKGKAESVWKDVLKPETVDRIDDMLRELDGTGLIIPDS